MSNFTTPAAEFRSIHLATVSLTARQSSEWKRSEQARCRYTGRAMRKANELGQAVRILSAGGLVLDTVQPQAVRVAELDAVEEVELDFSGL